MSKLYQCNHCARQSNDLEGYLEIASSNNSLSIINNANGNNSKQLSHYEDLHFCGQDCLNEFLFKPLEQSKLLVHALKIEMKSEAYSYGSAQDAFKKVINLIEIEIGHVS